MDGGVVSGCCVSIVPALLKGKIHLLNGVSERVGLELYGARACGKVASLVCVHEWLREGEGTIGPARQATPLRT